FEAFIGNKMVAFAVAVIAPMPVAIGYAVIAACALHPLLEYFVLIPAELRRNVLTPEPWSSVMIAVIAVAIYRHRVKEGILERAATRATGQKEAAEDLARKFLAIRDLSNTPLQTIGLAIALLRKEHPDAARLARVFQDCYDTLGELNELLAAYETEAKSS